MVVFAPQNLIADPPFSHLDLISCRNLLIYIETALQKKIIELFHYALNPGGHLFLGKSEHLGQQASLFEAIVQKWRIFKSVGPVRHVPIYFPLVSGTLGPSATSVAKRGGQPGPDHAALMRELLLEHHAPTAVLVNRDYRVLYFFGRSSDYLAQPGGELTDDLLRMARDGLRLKLRAALHQAIQENQPVKAVVPPVNGDPAVELTVAPLQDPRYAGLLLITFRETTERAPVSSESPAQVSDDDATRHLEAELDTHG